LDEDSSGKTTWLNIETPTIEIARSRPGHIGAPPWHIEITAEQYVELSNGSRSDGLGYRATIRTLQLQLTPADLSRLLDVALSNGLLQLSARL
jgi:hypothetical protein